MTSRGQTESPSGSTGGLCYVYARQRCRGRHLDDHHRQGQLALTLLEETATDAIHMIAEREIDDPSGREHLYWRAPHAIANIRGANVFPGYATFEAGWRIG